MHALVIPGKQTKKASHHPRAVTYQIRSPKLPWNPIYHFMHAYRPVHHALDEYNADIIEIGCPYRVPWLVQRHCKNSWSNKRPRLVGFYHADFPQSDVYNTLQTINRPLAKLGKNIAERYAVNLYNQMDLCLVAAPKIRERLVSWGVKRVECVPFGVDTEEFSPQQPKLPTQDKDKFRLLFVGRFSTDKGTLPLIEIMHEIVKAGIPAELTLIGSGFLAEKAQALAKQANYIRFLPPELDKGELAKIYSQHDLLVVANPYETFCLSALEAMACGTPVASLCGSGGIETIVNEKTGFRLGGELANLIPLLKNTTPKQLRAMRSGVRQHTVENFNQSARYKQLFELYEQLHG